MEVVTFLCGCVITALIAAAVAWGVFKRRRQFLQYVRRVGDNVMAGDYSQRVVKEGAGAEQEFAETVNRMLDALSSQLSELSRERDVLNHILQSMTTGVVLVGADGRIEMMNEASGRTLRGPEDQWRGKQHSQLFRNFGVCAAIDHALLNGTSWHGELKVRADLTLDARVVAVQMSSSEIGGKRTSYTALVLFNDVSEWRRVARMRSDFVANVSHELKTPITAIRGFAETLLSDVTDESSRHNFLQVIYDESVRMGNLVADLLTLSKLESSGDSIQPQTIGLRFVAERARQRVLGEAQQRGVELVPPDDVDVSVWADEDKLLQVFLNLLSNAVHYTAAGGRVIVNWSVKETKVEIHIQDTGIGIDKEHQERVFERFYRVDPHRSRATGGTGLGLAIVKHIITVHGGELGVNSAPGTGSDFWFTLLRSEPVMNFT
ncbi:sensor histidine kinase [Alicyclobacillaceae bacterium I2511]|nr:sensor histidine kinase [Alicyclobacillaceae bacterium I2511]